MKRLNFKSLTSGIIGVILRFHVVLVFIIGLAIMAYKEINDKDFEQSFNIWAYFILSIFISLAVTLFLEFATNRIARIISYLIPLGAVAAYCFLFFNDKNQWEIMQFVAVLFSAILSIYIVLFLRKKTDISFWIFSERISRELIISVIYTSLLQGGLSLAFYAVEMLFDVKINSEVYGNLAVTCFLIVAPVYFLMNIPSKDDLYNEKPDYVKFMKILGLYVFLPILGIYLSILYIYLFKIIIRWELPNGWVTTLVSVLAVGGYLAKFLLFPISENKVVNFLNRNFSLLLLPLIILMSVGLGRRIMDYGFSINRIYVLIFNLWLYGVSIHLFISKSRHIRWLVISFATVLFFASVGPWSVFAITKHIIKKDLTVMLAENKLFVDGKLVNNKGNKLNINDSIAEKVYEKTDYFYNTFGKKIWQESFNDKREELNLHEIVENIGVNSFSKTKKTKFINVSLTKNKIYEIEGYNKIFTNLENWDGDNLIFSNKDFKIELYNNNIVVNNYLKKNTITMPLKDVVSKVYFNDSDSSLNDKYLVSTTDSCMLIVNNISADCKSPTDFKVNSLNITILLK